MKITDVRVHVLRSALEQPFAFSQGWVSASLLLYIIGIAVSHAVLRPGHKRMNALMRELTSGGPAAAGAVGAPPQVAEMEQVGKRMAAAGMFLDILLVVIVYLMVFKPGA